MRGGRKVGQARESDRIARQRAFIGARLALYENISGRDAAQRAGCNRSAVQEAILILRHGTEAEIASVEAGDSSMRALRNTIHARINYDPKAKRIPVVTLDVAGQREFEAGVWKKLREALDALTSMPVATDMVTIVKKNAMRSEAVSRKLLTAHTWLEDFINAYTE